MIEFCNTHERAIALRQKRFDISKWEFEHEQSCRRRKRREFERLMSSVGFQAVLMAMWFATGWLVAQWQS